MLRSQLAQMRDVNAKRFQILVDGDKLEFCEMTASKTGWIPGPPQQEIEVRCAPGLNIITFDFGPEVEAVFPSNPIQWIDPGARSAGGGYVAVPEPECMEIQRDGNGRCSIWNRNLNYTGKDEEFAFLVVVLTDDGQIVGSSDPSMINEPDEGTGGDPEG